MPIDSLDDVRPGDLMIAGQSAAPAKLLVYGGQWLLREQFRIGKFAAGHAAVITPGGKLVEAMPHGARERDLTSEDWSDQTAFLRLPETYPGQALDAAFMAQMMIGTTYSIASYIYLAAYLDGFKSKWLAKRIDRRLPVDSFALPSGRQITVGLPVEEICSVLAEQAWTLTGYKVIHGTSPQVVTPGMLAEQLWNRPEVVKGAAWFV
jgi:hypothetical protein